MHTIISLGEEKISSSIFLSSRAVITDTSQTFDLQYRFETILYSKDGRFLSHTFKWGCSTDFSSSLRLFKYTSWVHKRISRKIRRRLKRYSVSEQIPDLQKIPGFQDFRVPELASA